MENTEYYKRKRRILDIFNRKKFFKEKYAQKTSDALLEKVEKELVHETTNSHKHISEIDEELAKTQSKFL